ncbi:MAG: hypothetical protein ACLFTF_09830 [Desulfonatronovibrio sp.]
MKQAHANIQDTFSSSWRTYIKGLEDSLKSLEEDINEAAEMSDKCTSEWCTATEHVIDELANSLYSIHEPSFATEEDSRKIKDLKKQVHNLYGKYQSIAK